MYKQIKDKELSPALRNRLNEIYLMLLTGTTKEILMVTFCISERKARDYVSYIKKHFPVISFSGEKGYKIAQTPSELEAVRRTKREYQSRIKEFEDIINPLEKFERSFE